ncbi:MAG: hypothetical protein Q8R76_08345 [Candidatus Omnitrophota bacterium]|nr:hypothetical protein [Candidatus Omnitrophota bacterium]
MKPTVFITGKREYLITMKVSEYSLKRNSKHPESFDVRLLYLQDFPYLTSRQGRRYKREPGILKWHNEDPQAFTLLRFLPPQLMNYENRAVVIDPDIFAVGDVYSLLTRDMRGKVILCKKKDYTNSKKPNRRSHFASSVMLLDCAHLKHWEWEKQLDAMFRMERHYNNWMNMRLEPEETIGALEDEWNHYDTLTPDTKLLHNTNRSTQPWLTGLPYDRRLKKHVEKMFGVFPAAWREGICSLLRGEGYLPYGRHERHPDANQEKLWFSLLKGALRDGFISESDLRNEIEKKHVRSDALAILETAEEPALA